MENARIRRAQTRLQAAPSYTHAARGVGFRVQRRAPSRCVSTQACPPHLVLPHERLHVLPQGPVLLAQRAVLALVGAQLRQRRGQLALQRRHLAAGGWGETGRRRGGEDRGAMGVGKNEKFYMHTWAEGRSPACCKSHVQLQAERWRTSGLLVHLRDSLSTQPPKPTPPRPPARGTCCPPLPRGPRQPRARATARRPPAARRRARGPAPPCARHARRGRPAGRGKSDGLVPMG